MFVHRYHFAYYQQVAVFFWPILFLELWRVDRWQAETGRRALQRLVGQIEAAQAGREATQSSSACEVVRPELVIRTSTRASVSTTRAADGRPSGVTASAQGENQDG